MESALVNCSASAAVDDPHAGFCLVKSLFVQDIVGFIGMGNVQADVIRFSKQFIQPQQGYIWQLGDLWVKSNNVHAKGNCPVCDC